MTEIIRIGVDIAKNVFEVHGVNAQEQVVVRRSLRRNQVLAWFGKLPACLIGMEACGTATHWARELTGLGHTVRLIPPAYAKAYVRRNKNDPADARAICEAVSRSAPTMGIHESTVLVTSRCAWAHGSAARRSWTSARCVNVSHCSIRA